MARHFVRRLVVDACVLRSAGGREHPDSAVCGRALEEIRSVGHIVVHTPAMYSEWMEHKSRYSLAWLSRMESKRLIESLPNDPVDQQLRARIEGSGQHVNRIKAAMKDVHLLEAARHTDRAIISVERRSKEIFMQIPKVLDGIAWVDPIQHTDAACKWLREGARAKSWRH